MFEKLIVGKVRFSTVGLASVNGVLTAEDVYDLSLPNLNKLAKGVNKEIKSNDEEDFISVRSKDDATMVLRLDFIKHVIAIKLDEKEARNNAAAKKEKRQKLLAARADIEDNALKSLSLAEIDKQLAETE